MFSDVVDLRDFYATDLGHTARRMIRRQVRAIWPNVSGQSVLGIGYATPFLGAFRLEAERTMALMPATQGVLPWPAEGPCQVVLADEAEIPLPDLSVDRVLMVHCVECTEQLRAMMREAWRVLSGSGRLMVVVPNRRGIWARLDRTPFGHGHPYSPSQLQRLLRDTMYTPTLQGEALFLPPVRGRWLLGAAPAWEEVGQRWFKAVAGVVVMEATKQIYAGSLAGGEPVRERVRAISPAAAREAAKGAAARTDSGRHPRLRLVSGDSGSTQTGGRDERDD